MVNDDMHGVELRRSNLRFLLHLCFWCEYLV